MSRGRGPRSFDPVEVGNLETDAWAAYYRPEWRAFLVAAVGMVGAGFGMGRLRAPRQPALGAVAGHGRPDRVAVAHQPV